MNLEPLSNVINCRGSKDYDVRGADEGYFVRHMLPLLSTVSVADRLETGLHAADAFLRVHL